MPFAKIFIAFLSSSVMLGACSISSNISPSAVRSDVSKIEKLEASSTPRVFVSADRIPVFTSISDRTTEKLDLYLTPSCPYCVSLYNGILNKDVLYSELLEGTAVTVFLVPLRKADFEIISNLTCLPGTEIPGAVSDYYSNILNLANAAGNIPVDDLVELSRRTATAAGASERQLSECRETGIIEASVMRNWKRARTLGRGRSWPLVVYRGNPTEASLPAEVIDLLKA